MEGVLRSSDALLGRPRPQVLYYMSWSETSSPTPHGSRRHQALHVVIPSLSRVVPGLFSRPPRHLFSSHTVT